MLVPGNANLCPDRMIGKRDRVLPALRLSLSALMPRCMGCDASGHAGRSHCGLEDGQGQWYFVGDPVLTPH
jgi:hypothetical protein